MIRRILAVTVSAACLLTAAAPAVAASRYYYPPVVKIGFISNCVRNGASASGCRCTINYIARRESLSAFGRAVELYNNGGPVPQILRRAASACGLSVL